MPKSSHAVCMPGCSFLLKGALHPSLERQRIAPGVWEGEQAPVPSGIVVSRVVHSVIPRAWASHAQALCKATDSGPQLTLWPAGMLASGTPSRLAVATEALYLFSCPMQHLSRPDQRKKGFLRSNSPSGESLRLCATSGLTFLGAQGTCVS